MQIISKYLSVVIPKELQITFKYGKHFDESRNLTNTDME